ncbi:MAG: AI-2E family transporter [Tenericutes bacterium]|nr:AI-2E family transporter [Mycoplasmatota bacterium]MDD7630217.1 AI-2E family transporter [bacterium]MDY4108041.1 AI-2E family transporter [Bacilli bacterium]
MKKDSTNYMLINCTIFIFMFYLLLKIGILNKVLDFILIIFLSFTLSYIIYPIYKKLNKKINKLLSVFIIYGTLISIIILFIYMIIPNTNFILKLNDLFTNILVFINKLNQKYNLNINLEEYLNNIINYFINNSVFLIKNIFNFFSKIVFIVILSICILINMELLKDLINKLKNKVLIYNINDALKNYLVANIKILVIQFVEYTFVFLLIGHPNYILLGILNSVNTFIPFVGSIITNVVAITTASVISKNLLIKTAIVSIVLPNIDAYLVSPKIYNSANKISKTLTIAAILIGGYLFDFYGIIFAIPITIIVIEVLKYYKIIPC